MFLTFVCFLLILLCKMAPTLVLKRVQCSQEQEGWDVPYGENLFVR